MNQPFVSIVARVAFAGAGWVAAASGVAGGAGCARPGTQSLHERDLRGASTVPNRLITAQDAARINGRAVPWEELIPGLSEAAGATVLREVALDRAAEDECRRRGISITDAAVRAEEDRLLESIGSRASAQRTESGAMLETVRQTRGLGPFRYAALLRRNAMLRALVRDEVELAPHEVEQAMLMRYGERFGVRVIVTDTEREAIALRAQLAKEGAGLDVAFARMAMERSVDPSAARGGVIEPINPVDPAYPAALCAALPDVPPGQMSGVIAMERGFAILLATGKVPAVNPPENAADLVRMEVRVRKERIAMEMAAKRLLSGTSITPLTPELEWSVRAAPGP